MKPISKETIEHADDFIFHLSDSQVKEWFEDLKKKQFNIWKECIRFSSWGNLPERIKFINRNQLVIIKCFEQYNISISIISLRDIQNFDSWWDRKANDSPKEMTAPDFFLKMGVEIKQEELTIYMVNKFEDAQKATNLFKKSEYGNIMAGCMGIIGIYTQKVKHLLPSSSN